MTSWLARAGLGLAIAGASFAASAANVTLTGWTFGSGNNVNLTFNNGLTYTGAAGGFSGSLTGTQAGQFNTDAFATYCIELTEGFGFANTPMTQYEVVAGSSYFANRYNNAGKATTLGKLLTFVYDNPTMVDTAAESTAMQLAVWNIIYDTDFSVTSPGSFSDSSGYATLTNTLLAGAAGVSVSKYNVFALEKAGTQDFLLAARVGGSAATFGVPEPSSWALGSTALLALMASALVRRRGQGRSERPQR